MTAQDDHARQSSLFLSPAQRELLAAVVDRIIPPGDGVPGADQVGVAEHVEGMAGRSARSRDLLSNGLKAIRTGSRQSHSKDFADLSERERTEVLKRVESQHTEFFTILVQESYSGYYSSPAVLRAKGLPLTPPQPEGYDIEPFDATLLDGVRRRGKAYRDA